MSKATLWPTSTVSAAKAWKAGSTSAIGGWPRTISGRMPWNGMPSLGDAAAGVDELVEALAAQQPAVDDADGADLDDLVAAGRVEAGGLGVEDGEGELGRAAGRRAPGCRVAGGEEVEVVVFRPLGGAGLGVAGRRRAAAGSGRTTGRAARSCSSQSSPPCRSATSRGESGEPPSPRSHRLGLPAGRIGGRGRAAGPGEVEVRPAAGRRRGGGSGRAARGLAEPAGEEGERLGQREAVDAEPERRRRPRWRRPAGRSRPRCAGRRR